MILTALAICLATNPLRLASEWTAPNQLPFERVHAIVRVNPETYVGGLKGLYQGREGRWTKLDERPVKQIVVDENSAWILFGDGSVDKVVPQANQLYYDILRDKAKRPWTSTIYRDPNGSILGGLGGWMERGGTTNETYRKEMDNDVVTSICRVDGDIWLGTQRKGLFVYSNAALKRYGFAAGLADSWITSMIYLNKQLIVGLADGGLVRKEGEKFVALESPCQKVRQMIAYNGRLVVGGMDGCWAQDGAGWQQLSNEECTCLSIVLGQLAVGSPTGLRWWKA